MNKIIIPKIDYTEEEKQAYYKYLKSLADKDHAMPDPQGLFTEGYRASGVEGE